MLSFVFLRVQVLWMTYPNCPRLSPDWPEWGPVSFPALDAGKHRVLGQLHAVQSSWPNGPAVP